MLQSWKVRRAQDTPIGVLCTIVLLDVLIREDEIKDCSVINTLYQSSLMKFINFASSFNLGRETMYATAHSLRIDSFLIDLRHSIAHGRESYNLEVLRNSHTMCMEWLRGYYWDKEAENIVDVDIKDLRYDADLEEKLENLLPFFDLMAELTHKNIDNFEELSQSRDVANEQQRWPTVKSYMESKRFTNFRQAFAHFKTILINTIASKSVRLNSRAFFHTMLTKSDFFMQAYENSKQSTAGVLDEGSEKEEEVEIVIPAKRSRKSKIRKNSIVNLYEDIIWHIAKCNYLPLFLEMLLQVYSNEGEKQSRRQSAHFWIIIALKSYEYYKKYCEFIKSDPIDQTVITHEIRNIYTYQLNANLNNVIIFAGAQIFPFHLKYTREFVIQLMGSIGGNEDDYDLCVSLLPLIYPRLTEEQIVEMKTLVDIMFNERRIGGKSGERHIVHSVKDIELIHETGAEDGKKKAIWKRDDSQVNWNTVPVGYEFTV
jgi:hypothetical protein